MCRYTNFLNCLEPMLTHKSFQTDQEKLQNALLCMDAALQLLDDANAPAHIGAHLDMAICRLKDSLRRSASEIPRLQRSKIARTI